MSNNYNLFDEVHEDQDLSDSRMKICNTCPFIKTVLKLKQCSKCGCILQVKTLFKSTSCPINKW
jgi:hypothetical protein